MTDLTHVPTWARVAYVCFIIDAFSRMIVGWRVASTTRTETVLETIEMARWSRGTQLTGLRCHSERVVNSPAALRRAARRDRRRPFDRHDGCYDNALAETVNGSYQAELIRGPARSGPWKNSERFNINTLEDLQVLRSARTVERTLSRD